MQDYNEDTETNSEWKMVKVKKKKKTKPDLGMAENKVNLLKIRRDISIDSENRKESLFVNAKPKCGDHFDRITKEHKTLVSGSYGFVNAPLGLGIAPSKWIRGVKTKQDQLVNTTYERESRKAQEAQNKCSKEVKNKDKCSRGVVLRNKGSREIIPRKSTRFRM
jgi:hypothetical protein